MSRRTVMDLFRRISALRITAAVLYDRGVAAGHGHVQLMQDTQPLRDELQREITVAATEDLAGMIAAARFLETEAEGHEKDARYLLEKRDNALDTAKRIRSAITARMHMENKISVMDGDYSATLIEGELTLR